MRRLLLLLIMSLCACSEPKPIPTDTPFKIGDIVCVGEKWVGVVDDIQWQSCKNKVLRYKIHHYEEALTCCNAEWFLQAQLSSGKCNGETL